jgi:hypothetical protein
LTKEDIKEINRIFDIKENKWFYRFLIMI